MSDDSYKIIFLDVNNIIAEENVELKDDDEELKPEIKKKFEVASWIIDNFIKNHILVDVEKEENFIYHLTSFINKIEKNKTKTLKTYQFYLFRKISEQINIKPHACFILFDLEKELPNKLLDKLMGILENIINNIKIYILGYYRSKNNIVTKKEKIVGFFGDEIEEIENKYLDVELNNENKSQIINEHIEKLMDEIFEENCILGGKKVNDTMAQSGCILI